MAQKPTDCALFIDEPIAKFLVAWRRSETKKLHEIAKVVGITKAKAVEIMQMAQAVGVFDESGNITAIANGLVDTIIKQRIEKLKG